MDPICIHEAGHAVVCKREFGRSPRSIVLDRAEGGAQHHASLGTPQHGNDANRFAAYYVGGQEAVKHAIKQGVLPRGTDADVGFVGPDDSDCDRAQLKRLDRWRISEGDARATARRALHEFWPVVLAVAAALEEKDRLDEAALETFLEPIVQRR